MLYMIVECKDPMLLEQWMAQWNDLMEFDVIPVITSAEAVTAVTPKL